MLGNGFDLYHNLLSHYNDFMSIGEYLIERHKICYEEFDEVSIYSELYDLTKTDKSFKKKFLTYEEAYKKTKINKEEYADFLDKLKSNCWFKYFLNLKVRKGWIDLENQISIVIEKFRKNDTYGLDEFLNVIKERNNYNDAIFKHISNYSFGKERNNVYIFDEYNQFINLLKQYLKIFVDNVLSNISNIYCSCNNHFKNQQYILTFNYTDTYSKLYDSTANIVHIHGKLDDQIVLGINSDEYDDVANNDCRYIKYKKYYQRITKHTLDGLNALINCIKLNRGYNELSIVGHSLDKSDRDIITVLFDLFDDIVVYFHNDEALDQYIKNLKLIFGAKELNKMTLSQKVTFKKLPPNEFIK